MSRATGDKTRGGGALGEFGGSGSLAEGGSNSWWNSGRRVWAEAREFGPQCWRSEPVVPGRASRPDARPPTNFNYDNTPIIRFKFKRMDCSSAAHNCSRDCRNPNPSPRHLVLHFLLGVHALLCIRLRDFFCDIHFPRALFLMKNMKRKKYLICMQPRAPYFSLISPSKCVYGKNRNSKSSLDLIREQGFYARITFYHNSRRTDSLFHLCSVIQSSTSDHCTIYSGMNIV